ncbi:MAG TPA: urease accessory protein UreD [Candidatus Baltobacteraceae bacterium]|nr:urease accessory protein UreD [Candidatus Baltobacteraceae bacterium]
MSSPAAAKDTPPTIDPEAPRVEARLALDFARDAATGATVLAASVQEPPLRVVRAFALEDGSALAHLHNVSGGLLGGDRLTLVVNVGAGASVQLTTTGGTRIYRPRRNAPPTTQTTDIRLGEDALLEYVPDAIIPYAGARFAQRTRIELAAGAGLFWWEVIAPGREARGEVFAYERIEMRTEVMAGGRLIAAENIRLDPRGSALRSIARLGEYRYWATFYICRVGLDLAAWLATEEHLRKAARDLKRPGETLWGVSTLLADGLVVRGLAVRGRDVLAGLHALWNTAKLRLYGRVAVPPRKVH